MSNIKIRIDQFEDSEWIFGRSDKNETAKKEPLWSLLFKYKYKDDDFILLNENKYNQSSADPFPKCKDAGVLVQMLKDQEWKYDLDSTKRYIVIDTEKTEKKNALNTETTHKNILGLDVRKNKRELFSSNLSALILEYVIKDENNRIKLFKYKDFKDKTKYKDLCEKYFP